MMLQLPLLVLLLLSLIVASVSGVAIAGFRRDYDPYHPLLDLDGEPFLTKEALLHLLDNYNSNKHFLFSRFQSPQTIRRVLDALNPRRGFAKFEGKDGRHGQTRSTKLGGDWVLAESLQTAVGCTPQDVLEAYLSATLQAKWNSKQVLECHMTLQNETDATTTTIKPFYQQDLVLKSQRIIRSHTGIMRYSQKITIDQVGGDDDDDHHQHHHHHQGGRKRNGNNQRGGRSNHKYCVSVQLMDPVASSRSSRTTTTLRKPFDVLDVYVNLEPSGNNVNIYAAGLMKVNRKVVPNLVVFDASGIAAGMAGKGTLWLAAHFQQQQQMREEQLDKSSSPALAKRRKAASIAHVPTKWPTIRSWWCPVPKIPLFHLARTSRQ